MSKTLTAALTALFLTISFSAQAGPCKRGDVRDAKGNCRSVPTVLAPRLTPPAPLPPLALPPPSVVAEAPTEPVEASPPVPTVVTTRSASVIAGRAGYVEGLTVAVCHGFVQISGVAWQTRPSMVEFTTHNFVQTQRSPR